MDIGNTGELENANAAEVFAAIHRANAVGMIHFKGPEDETVFVTVKRGLARHASGPAGEGEAAVKIVLGWREGEYRFIEDVRPDDEDFPPNISREFAEGLAGVEIGRPKKAASVKLPPLSILPAGDLAGTISPPTPTELVAELRKSKFTGCCAPGPAEERRGVFLFTRGDKAGGVMWDGEAYRKGDGAWEAYVTAFDPGSEECRLLTVGDEVAAAIAAAFSGVTAIGRLPAAVVNIEEYLAWAKESGVTGLVSIVAADRAANILITRGEVIGAVVAPETKIASDPEEALALYYSPGATVEAYIC